MTAPTITKPIPGLAIVGLTPDRHAAILRAELRDLIEDLSAHLPDAVDNVTPEVIDRLNHDTTLILGAIWRLSDATDRVRLCREREAIRDRTNARLSAIAAGVALEKMRDRMLAESSGDAPDVGWPR